MDRNWESIRNDALSLDPQHQAILVEEMVEQLTHTPHMEQWLKEAESRLDAYHAGKLGAVDLEQSLTNIEHLLSK
jgi:hypothetical protein